MNRFEYIFSLETNVLNSFGNRYLTSLRGHVQAVYQIAWSADSRLLVSGSADSTVKVWDMSTKKLQQDLPGHADEVSGLSKF